MSGILRPKAFVPVCVFSLLLASCAGPMWDGESMPGSRPRLPDVGWKGTEPSTSPPSAMSPFVPSDPRMGSTAEALAAPEAQTTPGSPLGVPRLLAGRGPVQPSSPDVFRNTYYDFPRETGGGAEATIFNAACAPIARVTQQFHDQVCVQGSGRLATGGTVSFAKRDCACAAICPRTGQKICFERLDPARFPHGRGATGHPITPLRTVAVDSTVIPLGTVLYIPEMAGLPRPDGSSHDGCFLAEDRGVKVMGRQIDVFTGDPAVTAQWNALVPSNQGVHVLIAPPRCLARP